MIIQANSIYGVLPAQAAATQRPVFSAAGAEPAVSGEKVSISSAARALAAQGQEGQEEAEGGETYDFSNMSPQNLLQTINELIKAGKMTVDETSSLIGLIPMAISKVAYDGEVPAAYYEPTNFFAKLQQAMAYDEYSHNEQGVIYDRKAIAALERFQGTKI